VGDVEDRSLAEELGHLLGKRGVQIRELATRLQPPDELSGGADADIAGNERLLEPLPVRVVTGIEGRRRGELAGESLPRLGERVAEAREESAAALLVRLRRRIRLAQQLSPATRRVATPRCG
jgi:sugar phosphate isomerase/epimerase